MASADDFPVTAIALQKTFDGTQDAVQVRLNGGLTRIVYSAYLDEPTCDNGRSECLGAGGNVAGIMIFA